MVNLKKRKSKLKKKIKKRKSKDAVSGPKWPGMTEKTVGLPCSEPPSTPLAGSLPLDAASLKLVPFWEMLHLPAQHFPAENVVILQPLQLCFLLGQ